MSRPPPPRHLRPAFTLVEAIVTMVVISTLGAVASGLIFAGVTAHHDADLRADLNQQASAALERLSAEFRSIPLDSSAGETAPLISSVTATSIDWNSNSSLFSSGGTLSLTDNGGPAAPLLTGVTDFTLQCYDESNAPLAATLSAPATHAIRRISICLSVSRAGVTESLRTRVFIRSTMLGAAP